MEYFILDGHETKGPFTAADLRDSLKRGKLTSTNLVRTAEEQPWTPLHRMLDDILADELPFPPAPPEPSVADVIATMVPDRASTGWLDALRAQPVRAGLAGIALAAVLAYLARWPMLVALPGLLLGVAAGLLLILRNRPVVGGIISLAAILLPIALAPRSERAPLVAHEPAPAPTPPPVVVKAATTTPAEIPIEVVTPPAPPERVAIAPALPPVSVPPTPAPPAATPKPFLDKLASAAHKLVDSLPSLPEVKPSPAALPPLPPVVAMPGTTTSTRPEDLVFLVDTGTGRGSGFLAAEQGKVYFFTNLHVISGAKKITARSAFTTLDFKDGTVEVAADRDLVRISVPAQPALQFGDSPTIDDAVAALGNSGGREVVTRLEGKVMGVGPAQIEVSSEFIPGNSGGPILGKDNRVLGVATYVLRTENVPDWIKSGTRFSSTRRFGVRVTDDVKWVPMPLAVLLRQTALQETAEKLLTEYIADIRVIAGGAFRDTLSTSFSDRTEVRIFVDAYNSECRKGPSRTNADHTRRLRDHVGRLSRSIRSTAQELRRQLGAVSKGYMKERESDLLNAFDQLATAIEKDERELFHL